MSSSVTQSVSSASQWLQKKLVDVHRVLLLLRTSLLASVLTLVEEGVQYRESPTEEVGGTARRVDCFQVPPFLGKQGLFLFAN